MFGVSSMEGMPVTLVLEPAVASLRELFSIPAGKMSLPLPQRLDLLLQIAEGLRAFHSAGVSCGNLTPNNVLLTESLVPKLTDGALRPLESNWLCREFDSLFVREDSPAGDVFSLARLTLYVGMMGCGEE